jgi:hypothetical protein
MDAQLYPDGGHIEESPNYAVNVINDLLEAYWLDRLKGDESKWAGERIQRLAQRDGVARAVVTPDAALAALSDTYRSTAAQMFTKARLILDSGDWPTRCRASATCGCSGPRRWSRCWTRTWRRSSPTAARASAWPDSGYYVMRSGSSTNARPAHVRRGPRPACLHGHFDLLNFELFGYGKPLISDPGLYKYDDRPQPRVRRQHPPRTTRSTWTATAIPSWRASTTQDRRRSVNERGRPSRRSPPIHFGDGLHDWERRSWAQHLV